MSEYEEKELLEKLQKIFSLEDKLEKTKIPSYIRRFFRKLCIREWKRVHGKPIFNLDDYVSAKNQRYAAKINDQTKIIERYQVNS